MTDAAARDDKGLVLVIEDDEPTTRVMRLILEMEGYRLRIVPNREEALDVIATEPPDVLITDYMMGGLTLEAFLDQARSSGFKGPILLCTALHQEFGLAVDDVLLKPFDPDELPKRLDVLLASKLPD
jgi:DNA-binding response OmpR family regulator